MELIGTLLVIHYDTQLASPSACVFRNRMLWRFGFFAAAGAIFPSGPISWMFVADSLTFACAMPNCLFSRSKTVYTADISGAPRDATVLLLDSNGRVHREFPSLSLIGAPLFVSGIKIIDKGRSTLAAWNSKLNLAPVSPLSHLSALVPSLNVWIFMAGPIWSKISGGRDNEGFPVSISAGGKFLPPNAVGCEVLPAKKEKEVQGMMKSSVFANSLPIRGIICICPVNFAVSIPPNTTLPVGAPVFR